jgi:hypothetical protein
MRVPLEGEQAALVVEAVGAVRAEVARANHTVTGDEEAEPVSGAEAAGGAGCPRCAGERSELPIGDGFATWYRPKCRSAVIEESGLIVEVDGDVLERSRLAGEIRLQQLHDFLDEGPTPARRFL